MTTAPATDLATDKSLASEAPQTNKQASSALQRWGVLLIVVLLLMVHLALVFDCAKEDSATFDEMGHLTAGLAYWRAGSYQLYNVNPPLPKLLGSLPVLVAKPDTRAIQLPVDPSDRPEWDVGERFARDNASRYHDFVVSARSVGLLWSLLGAAGVYLWAKMLWGQAGGLFALAIWCFEPNVIAHAHVLTPDMPAAAAGLWAAYLFRGYLVAPSWTAAVLAGVALGVAELCKFTLLIFYPTWCALWLCFVLRPRWTRVKRSGLAASCGQLGLLFALSILVVNAGYEFSGTGKQLKEFHFVSELLAGPRESWKVEEGVTYGNRFEGTILGELVAPVPEDMIGGIDVQRRGFEQNCHKCNKYLRGEWSESGWWYYYLYAAAVKVPLGLWGLLLFALLVPVWNRSSAHMSRGECLALWLPPLALFYFVSSHPRMQTHFRYLLPAVPFVIVYLGRAGQTLAGGRWQPGFVAAGLLLWAAASYLSIHPHSLAYFNELAGGPERGHYHLESSDIDWGQDLLRLKRWLGEHPEAKPLKLAYFNHIDPRIIGIRFKLPPLGVTSSAPTEPQAALQLGPHPGYFAVSARFVHGAELSSPDGAGGYCTAPFRSLEYFRYFQPIAKAGYSIYIYHITLEEANRVRQQYGLPTLSDDWKESSIQP